MGASVVSFDTTVLPSWTNHPTSYDPVGGGGISELNFKMHHWSGAVMRFLMVAIRYGRRRSMVASAIAIEHLIKGKMGKFFPMAIATLTTTAHLQEMSSLAASMTQMRCSSP